MTNPISRIQSDPEKEQLLAIIEQAFSGVRLEDGVSVNMAEYNDSGGSESRYLELAKSDEKDDWRKLSDTTLEEHTVTLSFSDLKGYKFHLPAYMRYAVRNHEWSRSISVDIAVYALNPDHYIFKKVAFEQWFTSEQITAIIKFLEYCVAHEGTLDGIIAGENLKKIKERIVST